MSKLVTLNTSGQSSRNAFAALSGAVLAVDVKKAENLRKTQAARAANKQRNATKTANARNVDSFVSNPA